MRRLVRVLGSARSELFLGYLYILRTPTPPSQDFIRVKWLVLPLHWVGVSLKDPALVCMYVYVCACRFVCFGFVCFVTISHAIHTKFALLLVDYFYCRRRRRGRLSPLGRPNSRRIELAPKNLHIGRAPFARRPNHTTVNSKHDILECAMELLLFEE